MMARTSAAGGLMVAPDDVAIDHGSDDNDTLIFNNNGEI